MLNNIHPLPAFSDNYIWIIADPASSAVCAVDPGDADAVIAYLNAKELTLSDILITHHHPDHTGGVSKLSELYGPRVIGPDSGKIRGITDPVSEGDEIELFSTKFAVLEIPGHTLDHIAFYSEDSGQPILFCGDTLFAGGCGRIFEGTPEMMFDSLGKLSALDSTTRVYCTHEYTLANLEFALAADPNNGRLQSRLEAEQDKRSTDTPTLPSTLQLELDTNPFLRCDKADLIASASQRDAQASAGEVAVFAALRAWKDSF